MGQARKLKRKVVQKKAIAMKIKWYNILPKTITMLLILKTISMQIILVKTNSILVQEKIELKLSHALPKKSRNTKKKLKAVRIKQNSENNKEKKIDEFND